MPETLQLSQEEWRYITELRGVLADNGKSTANVEAVLSQMGELARAIAQAGRMFKKMQGHFDAMPELRRHRAKENVQVCLQLLETMHRSMEGGLERAAVRFCYGCADLVAVYGRDGAAALERRFDGGAFKGSLCELRDDVARTKQYCDGAVSTNDGCIFLYPTRPGIWPVLAELARELIGKPSPDKARERLTQLFNAPFLAEKSRLSELQAEVEQAIGCAERLEQGVDAPRKERAAKPPTLAGELAEARKLVREPATKSPGRARGAELS